MATTKGVRKGFLLSLDAFVATALLLVLAVFVASLAFSYSTPELQYQRLYYAGKDVLNIVETVKIRDLQDYPVIQNYLNSSVLLQDDLDKTLLDVMGALWAAGNVTEANNITSQILGSLLNDTEFGCQILMDGESIYLKNTSTNKYFARLSSVVSGFSVGKPVSGFVSRVYLAKSQKTGNSYTYFGGFIGSGNVTVVATLPEYDSIIGMIMEADLGDNFSLYVNDNYSGFFTRNSGDKNLTPDLVKNFPLALPYLHEGDNIIKFVFQGNKTDFIGGGYLQIQYNTSQLLTESLQAFGSNATRKDLIPGVEGIINVYSSFYVPGALNNMSAYLHYFNNLSINGTGIDVYLSVGEKEIYRSSKLGEQKIYLNNSYLKGILKYANLSSQTVPYRFGTEEIALTGGEGTSDSVLITDRSGSMTTCDVGSNTTCDCNAPAPCDRYRINVAKEVDQDFVNTILVNYTGNRVGLVAFGTSVCSTTQITDNVSLLNSVINGYGANCGATCISCGVNRSTQSLISNSTILYTAIIPRATAWLYNTSYPSSQPPNDPNGADWKNATYNDSRWATGNAILGFESPPYPPNVVSNIGNNGGDYYFRRHFSIDDPDKILEAHLHVLSDDRAEVYLNGFLIDNDTAQHDAKYWNRPNESFSDDFETYYQNVAQQVDGYALNMSPGFWFIDDGNNNPTSFGEEVYVMSSQAGYPAHNGTDVLVFRDMDNYGYAETKINLSGTSKPVLSYFWRLGPDAPDSGEYSDVRIWDGSWRTLRAYTTSDSDDAYHYDEFDLSGYNKVANFTIRFGSRSSVDNERFYVEGVSVFDRIYVNKSYFVPGENVIAARLHNDDGTAAKFDLELNISFRRFKAMLVMSDGQANLCINGTFSTSQCSAEAISQGCQARKNGIVVYSVAFGADADNDTLAKVACWDCDAGSWVPGCNRYYSSTNSEELKNIYKEIAQNIANLSFSAQVLNVTGNVSRNNTLYPDSYFELNYTSNVPTPSFGEISLTFERSPFLSLNGTITNASRGTLDGYYFVPNTTRVIDAKITSYSAQYWTDRLYAKPSSSPYWTRVYWLQNYSSDYIQLGDPFLVNIPPDLVAMGENNSIGLGVASSPSVPYGGSNLSKVIYTLIVGGINLEGYSGVFPKAKGSTVTIYYDSNGDNSYDTSRITLVGPSPSDIFDPQNDSIDDAFMRLLDNMNFLYDLNEGSYGGPGTYDGLTLLNPLDLNIADIGISFSSTSVFGVPSLWGPASMEIRIWI